MSMFLAQEDIRKIIANLYPDAKTIRFIDHGYNNLIAEVDKKYIFRTPKTEGGLALFKIEGKLLNMLSNISTIPIPGLVQSSINPPYSVLTYLPGEHLENREIRALGNAVQKTIGKQLAEFVIDLNAQASVTEINQIRSSLHKRGAEPWDSYFKKVFSIQQKQPTLEKLNQKYYSLWKATTPSQTIVIHDDLHPANLLFKDKSLSGVLDLEQVNTGTVEQEFRNLYRLSEEVLEAAANRYRELTGAAVDIEAVKVWAITAELAALSRQINKQDTGHTSYKRAEAKLRFWLGDQFPL